MPSFTISLLFFSNNAVVKISHAIVLLPEPQEPPESLFIPITLTLPRSEILMTCSCAAIEKTL